MKPLFFFSYIMRAMLIPLRSLRREFRVWRTCRKLSELYKAGLPCYVQRAACWLVTRRLPEDIKPAIDLVEEIRDKLRSRGTERFQTYFSPETFSEQAVVTMERTAPGEVVSFTAEQLAQTISVDPVRGTFLHLCAKDKKARVVLELGACAGISGCYLGLAPNVQSFVTVEASSSLAALARDNLKAAGVRQATVINSLFDDALDKDLPFLLKERIDFAWIDGHHERIATLRYMFKILPSMKQNGIMLFDDIYWSADMLRAWREIETQEQFSDVIDCGICGIAIVGDGNQARPKKWDLTPLIAPAGIKPGDPQKIRDQA